LIAVRFVFLLGIYVVGRFLFSFVGARFGLSPDEAAAQAGLALTVLAAATVAASIPTGWLTDRFGRARLMQVGGLLGAAGIALLPFVPTVGALVLVGLLIAAGSAAFSSGSWALLSDLAAGPESGRLMGLAQLGTAGAAAAAGLFGLLVDAGERLSPGAGYMATFVVAAVAALVGGLMWRVEVRIPQPEVVR
jgi:MFS family permease